MSTELWKRLSSQSDTTLEVSEIAADPALKAEAERFLPALQARCEGCGEEAARRALQPLVLIYGITEAAKAPAFWEPYRKALAGVPAKALAAAIDEYVALPDSQFFPKPGPLKALADKAAEPIRRAAHRARLVTLVKPAPGRVEPTDEQRDQVRAMLGEFRSKMEARSLRKPKAPVLPPTHGAVDETGLTPQMQALLARRAEEAQP